MELESSRSKSRVTGESGRRTLRHQRLAATRKTRGRTHQKHHRTDDGMLFRVMVSALSQPSCRWSWIHSKLLFLNQMNGNLLLARCAPISKGSPAAVKAAVKV
jgi:hypothetical protein